MKNPGMSHPPQSPSQPLQSLPAPSTSFPCHQHPSGLVPGKERRRHVLPSILVVFIVLFSSLGILCGDAPESEGQMTTSNFKLFLTMDYKSKNEFRLDFTLNWGPNEYKENKVFLPTPTYLAWEELQTFSAINSSRLDTLRNTTIGSTGKTLFSDKEFFAQTVLGGDFQTGEAKFELRGIKQSDIAYYGEFDELIIKFTVKAKESSYTIKPLAFIYSIFDTMLPETRVVIKGSPSITISSSSFHFYHYMLLDGETFTTENLFDLSNENMLYDVESDEITIQETPFLLSSAILFYFIAFGFVVTGIALAIANRGSRYKVPKGFFLWVKVCAVYYVAFIPYHFYLTILLIIGVFIYLMRKASILNKRKKGMEGMKKKKTAADAAPGAPTPSQQLSTDEKRGFMPSQDEIQKILRTTESRVFTEVPAVPITSSPLTMETIETSSEILYLGDKLGFKVLLRNNQALPIQAVSVKPFFDTELYLIDSVQKNLDIIQSGQVGELFFELQPNGLLQNAIISGVITFYDASAGQYKNIDLSPVQTEILIPELAATTIDNHGFTMRTGNMLHISETIAGIALPAAVFHELVVKSLDELNFYKVPSDGARAVSGAGDMRFQQTGAGESHSSFNLGEPLHFDGNKAKAASLDSFTDRYFSETSFRTAIALESSIIHRDKNLSDLGISIWADNQRDLTLFYNIILFKLGQSIQTTDVEDYMVLEQTAQVKAAQAAHVAPEKTVKPKHKEDVQEMMAQLQRSVQEQMRLFGRAMMRGGSKDDVFQEIFPFHVKDLFLIEKRGGRLMKHISESTEEGDRIDRDVVSSMFTAIQDFVGDSFNVDKGQTLNQVKYGDSNILIEHSEDVFLAIVTTGEPPSFIRLRMADLLNNIGVSINVKQWDGDSSIVDPITPDLQSFIEECEKEQEKKDYTKALETLEDARENAEELQENNIDSPEGRRYLTIAKTKFKNGEYNECIKNAKLAVKAMKKDKKAHKEKDVGKSVDDLELKVESLLQKIGSKKEQAKELGAKEAKKEEPQSQAPEKKEEEGDAIEIIED